MPDTLEPPDSRATDCPWPSLEAPAHWHFIDCMADLHLQASQPATFAAWQHYLRHSKAQALFILGDLFEVWIGDDAVTTDNFASQCQQELANASQRMELFFMAGNRDFLIGQAFASSCQMQLLSDPSVLVFGGQRWLLSHGDALCLADTSYQQFRQMVRNPAWQADFLAQPLAKRQTMANALRAQSQAQQARQPFVDVDTAAAGQWLKTAAAATLIHGHTHRPADHLLDHGQRRLVLSDWDASATPARLELLRLHAKHPPKRWQAQPGAVPPT